MPRKGQRGVLPGRNVLTGGEWRTLPPRHKRVFHPSVFYILSGLPAPHDELVQQKLSSEERAELQDLYDELVCKQKVAMVYTKAAEGITEGPSLLDYNCHSKKRLEELHAQVRK